MGNRRPSCCPLGSWQSKEEQHKLLEHVAEDKVGPPMAEPACPEKGNARALMGSELQNCRPRNEHAAKEKAKDPLLAGFGTEETQVSLGEKRSGLLLLRL